jgi:crotonobetainyl-CoA:carnitine CoA-transferase CaiB-like acyl-CoA transferase
MHYKTGNVRKLVDTPVKFASVPEVKHERAPKFGEHTKQVMEDLGYSEAQIQELATNNVIIMGS